MQKKIFGLVLVFYFISCSNDNTKLEIVKNHLKSLGISHNELNSLNYKVTPILGKDAYDAAFKRLSKNEMRFQTTKSNHHIKGVYKQIDTLGLNYYKMREKNYFLVLAFKITGKDTVFKSLYYLTNQNKIYDFNNIKNEDRI
ncbi:hypothetical protein CLU81_0566 [Flavobacterium sp. 9]|uniref:hypothetical protein n=1 Tax=Flavobacterium sp. 9 TaxID=2035198 RepID=UPI000C19D98C|nr:hypothetical protein [Flavobacterium sp. 9]PIF30159.1 hypothetical protein CLU81_0566 [Flavobacterium sp. 9]